jgi:hypothetical protein
MRMDDQTAPISDLESAEKDLMRALPEAKLFSTHLIDDMHAAFEVVCSRLGLAPTSDKATELVVTKIVELAKAGRRGDDLAAETLRYFHASQPEQRVDRHPHAPSIMRLVTSHEPLISPSTNHTS